MRAPAAAALLVAALAALPCRGIDADTASTTDNQETGFHPTINILYQMLHTTDYNRTKVSNSNFESDDATVKECCKTEVTIESIQKGANVVNEPLNLDGNSKKNRQRRLVNVDRTVYGSFSEVKVAEITTVTSVLSPPPLMERRRKPGETGSSAPLLNYIFDTYSNTHQHRNGKVSPGNSIYAAAAPEIEALVGSTAHLDCKVDALHDKLVSWVRRKNDEQPMDLLTTGTQLYTTDDRYSARFIPPDIWRLEVKEVRPSDAAHYDCQLSAHPPRTARVTLHVPEVSVRIVDGAGAEVSEQVCELGSTVALRCEVRGLKMEGGPSLLWFRRDALLNDDTTRGGISVRTEFGANGANSVLRVARVRSDDAGRYTCSVARAPPPAPPPAHVILHVIKDTATYRLFQNEHGTLTLQVDSWYQYDVFNFDHPVNGYSARFIPPDIWRLEVKEVRPSDAAHYDCQLSAHPPRTARVTLHVPEVSVRIVDGAGAEVSEQVCELGSTVALRCEVRGLKMEGGPSLLWFRRDALLNDDTTRGGISVRTEFGANGANSVLRVARVRSDDAGRYTCSVARAPPPAPPPAHVILHVIKGESLAELHQGGSPTHRATQVWLVTLVAVLHRHVHIY